MPDYSFMLSPALANPRHWHVVIFDRLFKDDGDIIMLPTFVDKLGVPMRSVRKMAWRPNRQFVRGDRFGSASEEIQNLLRELGQHAIMPKGSTWSPIIAFNMTTGGGIVIFYSSDVTDGTDTSFDAFMWREVDADVLARLAVGFSEQEAASVENA